ncbi:SagB-type dehydrogenase domain protein [Candidatus Rubidus massiliensis]|nr:SagB-type dehydrogenase domain protein [Candidatus Rubidus massiliensis]
MSILIKINSRIKLTTYDNNSLTFIIDGKTPATFVTQTPKNHATVLAFINEGSSLYELQNQNFNDSLARLFLFIGLLKKNGLINYHFQFDNEESALICPKSNNFNDSVLKSENLMPESCSYILSRFSYFRREQDKIILDCPLASFRTALNTNFFIRFLPLINGENKLIDNQYKTIHEEHTWKTFFKLLIENFVIHPINEIEKEHLRFWEFHDLIFHSSSRRGEFDDNARFGATYRFQNKMTPPQTFKNITFDQGIKLYKPEDDENINKTPFYNILEKRKSVRSYSKNKKINLKDLGEFLYRSIGIREIVKTPKYDAIFRPYPGAGAIHEIDFYLVINACEGLRPGIYYYEPFNHELFRKNVEWQFVQKIISNAREAMGANSTTPQIVFTLTSQFKKIAWKYEKMSYRCTLISMGAIFQTMSLVATAMGLASCIVGSGDSSLFGKALNINSFQEGAIGEFALGIPSNEDL